MLNAKFASGPRGEETWTPTATYSESPFPVIEGTSACDATKMFNEQNADIKRSVHLLDLLRATFSHMGDRDGLTDPWLQRRVTLPSRHALDKYKNSLQEYIQRYSNEPSAPMSVRQAFKKDPAVIEQVAQIMRDQGPGPRDLKNKLINKLFNEAEKKPGGLDRFLHLVEKDLERFAKVTKEFENELQIFDRDHGLLPAHEIEEDGNAPGAHSG